MIIFDKKIGFTPKNGTLGGARTTKKFQKMWKLKKNILNFPRKHFGATSAPLEIDNAIICRIFDKIIIFDTQNYHF